MCLFQREQMNPCKTCFEWNNLKEGIKPESLFKLTGPKLDVSRPKLLCTGVI